MIYFPDWSDLAQVSNEMRNAWETEVALRETYRSYFDGDIFRRPVMSNCQRTKRRRSNSP